MLGNGRRQAGPPGDRLGDRFAAVVVAEHTIQRGFSQLGALVRHQAGDSGLVAGVDQGVGNGNRYLGTLGDGDLLGGGIFAAHDLDEVVVGEHLGVLEDRQRDTVDVACQGHRQVMRQVRRRLQVGGQGLADQHLGVGGQLAEDLFRQAALRFGHARILAIVLRRDLCGRLGPNIRRGISHQAGDVLLGKASCHLSLGQASTNARAPQAVIEPAFSTPQGADYRKLALIPA